MALQDSSLSLQTASSVNAIYGINRLPSELLIEIFKFQPWDDGYGYHLSDSTKGPWILAAVCRQWRQLVIGEPRLWGTLSMLFGVSHNPPVDIFLSYAQHTPLSFHVTLWEESTMPAGAMHSICQHAEAVGIENLTIWTLHPVTGYDHPKFRFLHHTQKLKTLNLFMAVRDNQNLSEFLVPFQHCPMLRQVFMNMGFCSGASPTMGPTSFPWMQLTTLSLIVSIMSMPLVVSILRLSRNLECFSLHGSEDEDYGANEYEENLENAGEQEPIALIHLRDLDIQMPTRLLSLLHCPALQSLHTEWVHIDDHTAFVEKYAAGPR
ncbi:hypothetical protein CYLTODRAFT_492005 [Cylindrobasidium torrendii FP15055 ss-10]|uniref:F-box domain-containing protein n=1 Tax=Cylindrobasidium torrendii FP15055 ss-10 TaxID=1314674 RepID=A0A0D7B6I2_9AGAR|nr:hypothetical protein CYLTODRAFT_492005 [Cylindrobasidium torrendii FP15055 ss-10]